MNDVQKTNRLSETASYLWVIAGTLLTLYIWAFLALKLIDAVVW